MLVTCTLLIGGISDLHMLVLCLGKTTFETTASLGCHCTSVRLFRPRAYSTKQDKLVSVIGIQSRIAERRHNCSWLWWPFWQCIWSRHWVHPQCFWWFWPGISWAQWYSAPYSYHWPLSSCASFFSFVPDWSLLEHLNSSPHARLAC